MMVAPVLANLGPLEDVTLTPNPQEVEEVFTVPLAHLLQAENQGYTHFRSKGRYSYTLPVFLNGPYKVWGLTAIITELTLELLAPDLYRRKTRVTGPLGASRTLWPHTPDWQEDAAGKLGQPGSRRHCPPVRGAASPFPRGSSGPAPVVDVPPCD
nr:PREDICTED: nucleoside diphosphate-linked moiety X motif 8, mitochondrial [Apteryx mantelli mantelli]